MADANAPGVVHSQIRCADFKSSKKFLDLLDFFRFFRFFSDFFRFFRFFSDFLNFGDFSKFFRIISEFFWVYEDLMNKKWI